MGGYELGTGKGDQPTDRPGASKGLPLMIDACPYAGNLCEHSSDLDLSTTQCFDGPTNYEACPRYQSFLARDSLSGRSGARSRANLIGFGAHTVFAEPIDQYAAAPSETRGGEQ